MRLGATFAARHSTNGSVAACRHTACLEGLDCTSLCDSVCMQEDDMGRLSARIGWAATSVATLYQTLGGGTSATVSGSVTAATLRNASDVHVYSFAAAPGTVTVTCDVLDAYKTIWQRSNINCQVRVLGQTGNVVGGAFNPTGTTTPTGLGTGQQTVNLTTGGT